MTKPKATPDDVRGKGEHAYIADGLRHLAVPLDTLTPDAANARRHGTRNMEAIKASLARWGQRQPIVVQRKGMVVRAGNGRLEAAKALGWTHIAAVVVDDDSADAVAFAIADNRTAELAEWDTETLATLLDTLPTEVKVDTGFTEADLDAMLAELTPKDVVEDTVPEPPITPITTPGTLWILGEHRLLCGDSTNADDVSRVMNGAKADCVFTDPPYGVNIQGMKNNKPTMIAGDLTQTAIPFSFDLSVTIATKDDARLYFCGGEGNLYLYQKLFEKHCRQLPRHLVWVKNGFTMKPNGYHNQYEIIFHGYKSGGGSLEKWFGPRTEDAASDVWQISRDAVGSYEHPTQKPVALPSRAIRNSCPPGGLVYEPFGGSGSTFIAAQQLGRRCFGLELSPAYCDVIVRRWQTLTGKRATLEDGTPFPEATP